MTVSEAEKLGYSKELMHCGLNESGTIIRMGRYNKDLGMPNVVEFIDVKPDPVEAKHEA